MVCDPRPNPTLTLTPFTYGRSKRAPLLEAGERDGAPRLESVSDMVRLLSLFLSLLGAEPPGTPFWRNENDGAPGRVPFRFPRTASTIIR